MNRKQDDGDSGHFTSKKLGKVKKFRISKSPSFKVEGEKVTINLSSNLLAPRIKFLRGVREYLCENRKLYCNFSSVLLHTFNRCGAGQTMLRD